MIHFNSHVQVAIDEQYKPSCSCFQCGEEVNCYVPYWHWRDIEFIDEKGKAYDE